MGRSVSYPSGAIVAFTVLEVENDDDWDFEYEWLREDLRERAGQAFPSLIAHDGWRGREDRILMRNAYADFGVSVYAGLAAVWIIERDDGPEHNAGCPRSPRVLKRCSATTSASVTCRTVKAFTQNGWPECASHFDRGEVPVLPNEACFCTHGLKPCEKGPGPAASLPQPGLRRPDFHQ